MKILLVLLCALLSVANAFGATLKRLADCYIKPCEIHGDFDGDGKADSAVLVKSSDGKKGIRIKLANGKVFFVGSGNPTGSGGDDFSWMDKWSLTTGPILQGAGEEPPPKAPGDHLLVERTEAASGMLYWNGSKFDWYQQGD